MPYLVLRITFFLSLLILLSACSTGPQGYAPVVDASPIEKIPKNGQYRVTREQTLYSIAWTYGLDYRYLAKINHINSPYTLKAGQIIYLKPHAAAAPTVVAHATPPRLPPRQSVASTRVKQPVVKPSFTPRVALQEPKIPVKQWLWPARGAVIGTYSGMNKGINITGHLGDPIRATASGRVVYSGHGLRGYGNLIIIKHNSTYLTAYAHNKKTFVHEGDWVTAGQEIAEMGNSDANRTLLHFEIRRNGQPVNPLMYLGKKV